MNPKTVHKYTDKDVVPKRTTQREYRTRTAPLDEYWPEIKVLLENSHAETHTKCMRSVSSAIGERHSRQKVAGTLRRAVRSQACARILGGPYRSSVFKLCC